MRVRDLQSTDSFRRRVLVVMKSEVHVRYIGSESLGSTNLVIHQGVANIFQ